MAVLQVKTSGGESSAIEEAELRKLKRGFRGQIARKDEEGYDTRCRLWNGMYDKYPAVVARRADPEDVARAIGFAREHGLLVALRGGGHSVAGFSACDDGMVIDLSLMQKVEVDLETRTVWVEAGTTWAHLDRVTQEHALAAPGGVVSTTGVAGLTLGGGYGWLRRKYGLSCDNVVSAEVVTVDGRWLVASEDDNADLFWALRGGGGNFGIVTAFEFRLHPIGPDVMYAVTLYPLDRGREVITAWRDFMAQAPDEISSDVTPWTVPHDPELPAELHGQPIVMLEAVYAGSAEEGQKTLRPLQNLSEPLLDLSSITPYVAAQSSVDELLPVREKCYYWKSLNLTELGDQAIDTIIEECRQRPSKAALVPIRYLGGAISRVAPAATAFAERSSPILLSIDAACDDSAHTDKNIEGTRGFWQRMVPYSTGGAYLNFGAAGEDGNTLVRQSYGRNYQRLTRRFVHTGEPAYRALGDESDVAAGRTDLPRDRALAALALEHLDYVAHRNLHSTLRIHRAIRGGYTP